MNKEILESFENEGTLFARYWLSSKMTPEISAETFERIIEPHFTVLLQGWEARNWAIYPDSDAEIQGFLQEAVEAMRRGWQAEMDKTLETRRIWNILNKSDE